MARVSLGPFSLEPAEGWSLSSVIMAGPLDGPPGAFQRNMITTMEQVGPRETPKSYVARQVKSLEAAKVARSEARPPEVVQLSEGEGLLTEQVIEGQGGDKVRQLQLVFIKDRVAFTAIASHKDGPAFEAARPELRKMLLSFR